MEQHLLVTITRLGVWPLRTQLQHIIANCQTGWLPPVRAGLGIPGDWQSALIFPLEWSLAQGLLIGGSTLGGCWGTMWFVILLATCLWGDPLVTPLSPAFLFWIVRMIKYYRHQPSWCWPWFLLPSEWCVTSYSEPFFAGYKHDFRLKDTEIMGLS